MRPSDLASLSQDYRYRLLVEAITDYAVYMLDPTGVVASWNPGAQRFKGYAAHEIMGQHFSRFYTKEDQTAGVPTHALQTAAREGKFENEGWRVRKNGSRFWAYVVIDPIRDESGKIIGFAKITRSDCKHCSENTQGWRRREVSRRRQFQALISVHHRADVAHGPVADGQWRLSLSACWG